MVHFDDSPYRSDLDSVGRFCRERGRRVVLRRGERFLCAGSRADSLGFVVRGGVSYRCCDGGGVEHTVGFAFEGDCAVDCASFVRGAPARFDIRAVVDSELWAVDRSQLVRWLDGQEAPRPLGRRLGEGLLAGVSERLLDFYLHRPEERYLRLVERCPRLPEMLPLREIASLVGVRPESLSRIRRRLCGLTKGI